MKFARLFGFLCVALILVPMAHADGSQVSMVFNNVNGVNDGQYYVSPYNGSMNGQSVTLFCDDVLNEVNFGQTWQANVTNLGTAITNQDFSLTRYGGVPSSAVFGNAAQTYQEAVWLTTQFALYPSSFVDLQYALWYLMNPSTTDPTLTKYDTQAAQGWLNKAQAGYNDGSFNPYDYSIITNISTPDQPLALYGSGQVQEFIVLTPEPGTLTLLLGGMLVLAIGVLRRAS
jgi:hypothetical protein